MRLPLQDKNETRFKTYRTICDYLTGHEDTAPPLQPHGHHLSEIR